MTTRKEELKKEIGQYQNLLSKSYIYQDEREAYEEEERVIQAELKGIEETEEYYKVEHSQMKMELAKKNKEFADWLDKIKLMLDNSSGYSVINASNDIKEKIKELRGGK